MARRRAILIGISSILVPYAISYQAIAAETIFFIPNPLLFILGIFVLAKSEPVVEPDIELADEDGEPISGLQELEPSIKVPVAYVVKSKLIEVKRRIAKSRDAS
jgi:hypothetical protein